MVNRDAVFGKNYYSLLLILLAVFHFEGCKQKDVVKNKVIKLAPADAAKMARAVESLAKPVVADSLSVSLWGVDSLVISPIAIDIDDSGKVYYVTTNRRKSAEIDIRNHQDWEIPSIQFQTVEDRRAFLHKTLSPENSKNNTWINDVNGDGSHDWKDMTVEKENVFRLDDLDGDGVADQSELIVEDFHSEVTDVAAGLLIDGNNLFVAVAPDLWRMKDNNGDGIPDEKTSISHGYGIHIGFGGHNMSGVEMGPDGRIYWQVGDIGFNGKDQDGNKWESPNSGVIVRSNPDGSDFEIFASGLRNTHEFVFDEYANLISEDNDGDHAGEKERLVYVVNGSDAGWRSNWQYGKYNDPDNNSYKVWMEEKLWMPRFAGQAAHITPCIANFVSGPAGMVYNPGTALGPKYQNNFFITEFVGTPTKSGVHSFKLKPSGATFKLGEHNKILSNILPTGMDFGPDGALYVADWIEGWNPKSYGRIWKLDAKNGSANAERSQTKTLLAANFKSLSEDELGELLKNPDMRVRLKSQFELVKRGSKGASAFEKALAQKNNQLARVNAIWGISQFARKEKKYAQILLPLLHDIDPEIRAQAAKWLGDIKFEEAGDKLIPLLRNADSRNRFFAAEALGRIMFEPAIKPIIDMLKDNNGADAYLVHAGSLALARIGKPEEIIALAKSASPSLRIAAVVALRRMGNPGISNFLNDTDEFVVTEAARGINDDLSIKDALPALANLLRNTPFNNEALVRRAINANLRVGTDEALQNLVDYSMKESNPVIMRTEAIETLGTWTQPSVLDRVDGRYRGVIKRDPAMAKSKAGTALIRLLKDKQTNIRSTAIKAISKLRLTEGAPAILGVLKNDPVAGVKVEAIKALAAIQYEQIGDAIKQAIADRDKSVRIAGLNLLEKSNISKDLMVTMLSEIIDTKTAEEKQASLLTLGKLPIKNTGIVFERLLQQMANGKLSPDIHLELAEAIDSSGSPELIARYKKVSSIQSPDTLFAAYKGSLFGGDEERGRKIFYSNETSQCLRCHSYDDFGGNAGPRLNGVGSRLTRQLILESLINPGARLAPGFGTVTLELKNGKTISGVLEEENNITLTIKSVDRLKESIPKKQIVKRTNSASSMPDMKYLLSKKEIRDVVSFLAAQKK